MKLFHKLVIGYLIVISVISLFLSIILVDVIESSLTNYSVYREREISSFVRVLNVTIVDDEKLIEREEIQDIFEHITDSLPHIKRLTLHDKEKITGDYIHAVSTDKSIINSPSHTEDVEAIHENTTTILYETAPNGEKLIDITYPVKSDSGKVLAAMGAAVSLTESDEVLQKAINIMREDALKGIIVSILMALILSSMFIVVGIKRMIAPLEKLREAISSFSKHKKTHNLDIISNDEIGELSKEFNSMSKELQLFYDSMESQINQKSLELETQYLTDNLTGLQNRESLVRFIDKKTKFHLAILDIASFKDINDSYGVEIGNRVIQRLGEKSRSYLEAKNLKVYRLGGDELAIVNPDVLVKADFQESIEMLIKNIEHEMFYFEDNDLEINISLHAGISFDNTYVLEKANIALVDAKQGHLDCVVYKSGQHNENKQIENLEMISKIKYAVVNYGLIAYYQPIVDRNSKVIKYETLVRMKDKKNILGPYYFLDIAKKTKYYNEITRAMIHQAFVEFEESEMSFSVNIEADDIMNKDTVDFIRNQLQSFKEPQRVVFELVESEDVHNIPHIREFISFIKKCGAKIAIDDFGTGYSNFSYLLDLEPDYIKIDGSLIKNIDRDEKSYTVVKTLVSIAHGLGISVIAEFVHSQEVLSICQELGIDEFQGYYFSEPLAKLQE